MAFEPGETIFYMRESRPHSAAVLARLTVENLHDDWADTKEQTALFRPFGPARVQYSTCHGFVDEREAFATKDALLSSLVGSAEAQPS